MKLLAGLGNPGKEYERTRHNVGFLAVDALARDEGVSFRKRFSSEAGEALVGSEKVLLLKPQTFMNRSGQAVGPATHFHHLSPKDVIVIHDDLDLEFGEVRIKVGGGHGGHNGLRSLIAHLGSPDFIRIRVGIGRPPWKGDVTGWVLGAFDEEQNEALPEVLERAVQAARCVIEQADPRICMNEFNRRVEKDSA